MRRLFDMPEEVFLCDADALIEIRTARLLNRLRSLARNGQVKIPGGVFREVQRHTDELARTLRAWDKNYAFVIDVARIRHAPALLPGLEQAYGPEFTIGGHTYPDSGEAAAAGEPPTRSSSLSAGR